jgi:L-threonylcarbamoyladenylate synthase
MQLDKSAIAQKLLSGAVIVLPTDTVYGLVCSAHIPEAVSRMYEIKKRDGKPGTIIAGSVEQLITLGFAGRDVERAAQFWPDAVSVVMLAGEKLSYLHMGLDSLAVRIPKPEWLRELLIQTGPLATTSANFPGDPTVTHVEQAKELFGEQVDLYVDGGDLSGAQPSSIIRLVSDGTYEKLR